MPKFLVKSTIIVISFLFGVCLSEEGLSEKVRYHGLHDAIRYPAPEHPYLVAVSGNVRRDFADVHHTKSNYYACTGALITLDTVLIGGRCGLLLKPSLGVDLLVSAGSEVLDLNLGAKVDAVLMKPSTMEQYNSQAYPDFTLALLKLEKPLTESKVVKPVNFSKALNYTFQNCRRGVDVFGLVPTKHKLKVNIEHAPLPLRRYKFCTNITRKIEKMADFSLCVESRLAKKNINDEPLDEAPRVVCQEDVGMPAFCRNLFVGFSHSLYKTPLNSPNCTPANASTIFLWTDDALKWIENKTGINVSYTTTTTTSTSTSESPGGGGGGGDHWSGAAALSTREPILLLMFVYLCLYLI